MPPRIVVLLGIMLVSTPARAADVAPLPLQTARLLGGKSTLAEIGFPEDVPRAQIIPSLIRHMHATHEGEDASLDEKRQRLLDTLTILARADAAAAAWPAG